MKPARPCWRQHSTDLILRLVPVFQIPVPQDHLKQTKSIQQMSECHLCVFAHADMHFYTERAHFLLLRCVCVFTGGTARSETGCQPPVCASIWIRSVVTVYIEDFLDCAMHVLLQVCTPDCDMPLTKEKRRKESHWNHRSASTIGLWDLIWWQLRQSAAFPRWLLVTRQQRARLTATYSPGCVTLQFTRVWAQKQHVTGDDQRGQRGRKGDALSGFRLVQSGC